MSNFMFQDIANFVILRALLKKATPVCTVAHANTRLNMARNLRSVRASSAMLSNREAAAPTEVFEPRVAATSVLNLPIDQVLGQLRDHPHRRTSQMPATMAFGYRTRNDSSLVQSPKVSFLHKESRLHCL